MSLQEESYSAISRPGDSTGVGTVFWQCDATGVNTVSPVKAKQDNLHLLNREPLITTMFTAPVVGAYPLFVVQEGIWVVSIVSLIQQTNGSSITFDVLWAASGTAGGSGTTQLTAVIAGGTAGNNNKFVNGTVIAAPTQAGPGNILWTNIGGTVTGFIGALQVALSRIA